MNIQTLIHNDIKIIKTFLTLFWLIMNNLLKHKCFKNYNKEIQNLSMSSFPIQVMKLFQWIILGNVLEHMTEYKGFTKVVHSKI